MKIGSICSGYGGLEQGIQAVIPGQLAWVAEYAPPTRKNPKPSQAAAQVLAHRYPGVPNLGDITVTDWAPLERVDVVCGGTPCQDVSMAGVRRGMRGGTRSGIWASMVDAIDCHRPALVVWENVRGVLSVQADSTVESCPICMGDERECNLRALGRVLGDLADIGYDTVWCGLRASDVGAAHARFRVFVVAWPATEPAGDGRNERGPEPARQLGRPDAAVGGSESPTDAGRVRGKPGRIAAPGQESARGSSGATEGRRGTCAVADAEDDGLASLVTGRSEPARSGAEVDSRHAAGVDFGEYGAAVRRWESVLGRLAPQPTEVSGRSVRPKLAPRFVEWLMGLPDGWVTDVPGLTRNDQLHVLGNGVVPQQAAEAVRRLLPHAPDWVRATLYGEDPDDGY